MDKDELRLKFEKSVQYLQRNIPPDDIYPFAEQTIMAALYFLDRWCDCVDIAEIYKNDVIAKKWINNIVGLQLCKQKDIDIDLDLNLESIEEGEENGRKT